MPNELPEQESVVTQELEKPRHLHALILIGIATFVLGVSAFFLVKGKFLDNFIDNSLKRNSTETISENSEDSLSEGNQVPVVPESGSNIQDTSEFIWDGKVLSISEESITLERNFDKNTFELILTPESNVTKKQIIDEDTSLRTPVDRSEIIIGQSVSVILLQSDTSIISEIIIL